MQIRRRNGLSGRQMLGSLAKRNLKNCCTSRTRFPGSFVSGTVRLFPTRIGRNLFLFRWKKKRKREKKGNLLFASC